jgi:starvation-inducible DNA-binding protein
MNKASHTLPPFLRKEAIGVLNRTLAELLDLFVRTKQIYWNLRGISFVDLHRVLDECAKRTLDHIDSAAELAMALGGRVESTRSRSAIPFPPERKEPFSIAGISLWLQELAKMNAAYSEHVHAAIGKMTEAGEFGTADLLTVIAWDLDEQFWMLEAHLDQP